MRYLAWLVVATLLWLPAAYRAQEACPAALPTRLIVGEQGRVTPGSNNNVRDLPTRSGTRVGVLSAGAVFDVLDGPTCADGLAWFRIRAGSLEGWTVESLEGSYALEPVVPASLDSAATATPTPLKAGPFITNVDQFELSLAIVPELGNLDNLGINYRALVSGVPYYRLMLVQQPSFQIRLYDRGRFQDRYPGSMDALASRLSGTSDTFDALWQQGIYEPDGGFLDMALNAHIERIQLSTSFALRSLRVRPEGLEYAAYGLVENVYVAVVASIPFDVAPYRSDAAALNALPLDAISPRIRRLDQMLVTLTVNEDELLPRLQPAAPLTRPLVCEGRIQRLEAGSRARQRLTNDPLRVRDAPNGTPTGEVVAPRAFVWIVSEPQCANGQIWWRISRDSDPLQPIGWVAESSSTTLFFELMAYEGQPAVIILPDGRLAQPTPDPAFFCQITASEPFNVWEFPREDISKPDGWYAACWGV